MKIVHEKGVHKVITSGYSPYRAMTMRATPIDSDGCVRISIPDEAGNYQDIAELIGGLAWLMVECAPRGERLSDEQKLTTGNNAKINARYNELVGTWKLSIPDSNSHFEEEALAQLVGFLVMLMADLKARENANHSK